MEPNLVLELACRICGVTGEGINDGVCAACAESNARGQGQSVSPSLIPISPVSDSGMNDGQESPAPAKVAATAAPARPVFLDKFGDYEIEYELARGGMGVVYVAKQMSLNRRVALKMILTPFASIDDLRRFRDEALNAATLEHPNIVPVYDFGEKNGQLFFAMKLIQGRSLHEEIRRLFMNPKKAIGILAQVARAIHHAHRHGILHRDLKPGNVLVDENGVPHVTDFGLAKRIDDEGLTQTGMVMGTAQYMPPEQAAGQVRKISVESDVYSLGAILYETLTMRPPFEADGHLEVLLKVKNEDPVPPRKLRPVVDRDLETICLKCLEKEPAKRYRTAAELADELERWLRGDPILARPHSLVEKASKWVRRNRAIAASLVLAALLALSVIAFVINGFAMRRHAEEQKAAERSKTADEAFEAGRAALAEALKSDATFAGRDGKLLEAEDRFRAALFLNPNHAAAAANLRDAALVHFDDALAQKDWRQAREKLLLARGAGLIATEYDGRAAELLKLESARENEVRSRVSFLLDDAASSRRTIIYDVALNELISLRDPLTVKLLTEAIGSENAEKRKLAISALAWIGNSSLVPVVLRHIQGRTPDGRENPPGAQEAAITAVCMLGRNTDKAAFEAVRDRIDAEPGQRDSPLFERVKPVYQAFARRVDLDKTKPLTAPDWVARAKDYQERQMKVEAREAYDEALFVDPINVDALMGRGLLKRHNKDSRGALADFLAARKIGPETAEMNSQIGWAKFSLKDYGGAIADLSRAIEMDPNLAEAYGNRANCYDKIGNSAKAMSDYNRGLELRPGHFMMRMGRGYLRMHLKDLDGCMDDFKVLQTNAPRSVDARLAMTDAMESIGNLKGALTELERAQDINPNFDFIYLKRGTIEVKRENYEAAVKNYDRAIELNPKNAITYYSRGVSRERLGDPSGALADYDQAIRVSPVYAEAWINRGALRLNQGDFKGASADFERGLEIDPHKAEGYVNRAVLKHKMGDDAGAMADFDRAVENGSRKVETFASRGQVQIERGKFKEALADYNAALDVNPKDKRLLDKVMALSDVLKDNAAKIEALRRFTVSSPNNAGSLNAYARELVTAADEKLRDPAKALPIAQKAVQISKGENAEFLETLARAQFGTGNKAQAIVTVKRALALLKGETHEKERAAMQGVLKEFEAGKP